MTPLITKTQLEFDIVSLNNDIKIITHEHHYRGDNQISLKYREGHFNNRWYDGCGSAVMKKSSGEYILDINNNPIYRFYENEFKYLNPELKDTYIEYVYHEVSRYYDISRFRIMKMPSKKCLSWHRDAEPRLHIAINTNPGCFMITDDGYSTHIPADGYVYYWDTTKHHTAINSGTTDRIHLLFNIKT